MKEKKPIISVRNVAVIYNRRRSLFHRDPFAAIKDVSLDLHAGDSLGVIGRNGVGKSTLLKLLADIIQPDRGWIRNYGVSTAMLSLKVGFSPHSTGRTNIMLSALLLGFTEDEIKARMEDIISFSELGDFIDQPILSYSAGMKARLGFSICYYMKPDVLLIDEALGVGDIAFRKKSATAMKEKIRSDQTVVLVSHEPRAIQEICNRAIWIEEGVTQMEGDAARVVKEYQDFVRLNPKPIQDLRI